MLAPDVELGVALGECLGSFVGQPGRELEGEGFDALALRPVPALDEKNPVLDGEDSPIDAFDVRDVRLDAESGADHKLEVFLRRSERRTEWAVVLERMRHVAQVSLSRVMHEASKRVLGVAAALLDDLRHKYGMLRNGIEEATVTAEPALVGEGARDVAYVELGWIRVEGIDPSARDRLQVRTGSGGTITRCGHPSILISW